jgi:outer membrane receptor for Fe3+-dicitrate
MDLYLNSFIDAEMVYYLNKKGREKVGAEKIVTRNQQCKHTLMRNDIYIKYGCPKDWRNEFPIKTKELNFIADAVFQVGEKQYFLEVDNQQKMRANKKKLENYLMFKEVGNWLKYHKSFPTLIFYTVTEARKAQLQELNPGLDLIVFTVADLF